MARLNPRIRVLSKSRDGYATKACLCGIPRADFDLFIELITEQGAHEYQYVLDAIIHAMNVGPTKGISISGRNKTVTVTVEAPVNSHAIQGLFHLKTLASLGLSDRLDKERGKESYTILRERAGAYARMHCILAMLDFDADRKRQEQYYPAYVAMRSLQTCSPLEIKRRRESVISDRKFRVGMAEIFANKSGKAAVAASLDLVLEVTK